jgi:hypothetical protein
VIYLRLVGTVLVCSFGLLVLGVAVNLMRKAWHTPDQVEANDLDNGALWGIIFGFLIILGGLAITLA